MNVRGFIWHREVVDKLLWKHNVTTAEVEEAFGNKPRYRFLEAGDVAGEDLYAVFGQSDSGRYLIVYFVYKKTGDALPISAREMTKKERRSYGKK
ncbi:MAG: BrnT family toxin [candidate division KSB1 bacterium]